MSPSSSDRGRGERGAVIIEFALVAPVVIMLILAVIDFGLTYNDAINVRQGVRDGAREAVAGELGSDADCEGLTTSTASQQARRIMCTTRDRIGLDPDDTRIGICLRPVGASTCSLTISDYEPDSALIVCGMYPAHSRSGLFSSFLNDEFFTTRVVMRVEQVESEIEDITDDLVSAFETPLEGQSWDFCGP